MSAPTLPVPAPPLPLPAPAARRAGPPRWWRPATATAAWGVVVAVCALWAYGGGLRDLGDLGGALVSLGRLTGLVASALLLLQVVLMARVPVVERAWGQDALARAHRVVGFSSFVLLWVHVVLISAGYAARSPLGLLGTLADLVLDYPGMLLALAGTVALCLVVVTSLARARRRLRRESWHLLHLYGYLGAGLVLPHQLWTGADFLGSRLATVVWWGLWGATAGAVLLWRVAVPLHRSLRAPLRVVDVVPAGPGATTVRVGGPGVAALQARGGQFFQWRFLGAPGWTRAHPYSLSAAPGRDTLEVTVAHVGDGSAAVADLRPGARVLLEGPYGRLHDGVRTRPRVLLMGSGVGVAPLRSLLGDLGDDVEDAVLVHRVRTPHDALVAQSARTAQAVGARYVPLAGRRAPGSWLPLGATSLDDAAAVAHLVPDVASREVYLCGAPGWTDAVVAALRALGVPDDAVHRESFEL
ncbi:ferric reductase-like transmembrane domain-containing protein [Janibacter melonis]|uniref:ferredoxin reductase family protein n=1 Tax=Janibacter melonis TaxID=262209 RepID=UPI00191AD2F7|nr:ferredoxin reductase family protein [Janibacter melonis]